MFKLRACISHTPPQARGHSTASTKLMRENYLVPLKECIAIPWLLLLRSTLVLRQGLRDRKSALVPLSGRDIHFPRRGNDAELALSCHNFLSGQKCSVKNSFALKPCWLNVACSLAQACFSTHHRERRKSLPQMFCKLMEATTQMQVGRRAYFQRHAYIDKYSSIDGIV